MAFRKLGVAPGCFRGKVGFLTVFGDVLSSFLLHIFVSPQNLLSKLCLFSVDQEIWSACCSSPRIFPKFTANALLPVFLSSG